jgi:hypothetical protein
VLVRLGCNIDAVDFLPNRITPLALAAARGRTPLVR